MANKRQRKKRYKKNVLKIKQLAKSVRLTAPEIQKSHGISPKFKQLLEETYQEDKGTMDLIKQGENDFCDDSKWVGFRHSITNEDCEWDTMKPVGKEIIHDSATDEDLEWEDTTKTVSKEKLRSSDQLMRVWEVIVAREDDPLVELDELITEISVEDDDNQSKFWKTVDDQAEKYGSINTPEVYWGNDVELDDID